MVCFDGLISSAFSVALIDAHVCATEQIPQILEVICDGSSYFLPTSIASKNLGDSGILNINFSIFLFFTSRIKSP
ncbi:hypothetical protein ES703_91560 [subsurface metagenome]